MVIPYQQMILDRLEDEVLKTEPLMASGPTRYIVSTSYNFSNNGRLVVTRRTDLATIATADFDFQAERAFIILNNELGPKSMMVSQSPDSFFWKIGRPDEDATVQILMARWRELLKEGDR